MKSKLLNGFYDPKTQCYVRVYLTPTNRVVRVYEFAPRSIPTAEVA